MNQELTFKEFTAQMEARSDINKKGITPDIVVKLTEDDVKNKNDLQLKKAVEVLSKMTSGQSIAIY